MIEIGEPTVAITAKVVDFIIRYIRYLLPYKVRLRLFAMDVFEAARAMPPAVYMYQVDVDGLMMQIDLLREYYRLKPLEEVESC